MRRYAAGTEFHIGKIELVANTGTYLDSPFHRYADGIDLAELDLASLTELDAIVVRAAGMTGRAIDRAAFAHADVRGQGGARPHRLGRALAHRRRTSRVIRFSRTKLPSTCSRTARGSVGIDSLNIDDTSGGERPVHSTLLGAGVPIVEHLRGLEQVPTSGFRFSAVPPKVRGMGTFPVRAYAAVPRAA